MNQTPFFVPKLGVAMTEAMLAEWLVDDGAAVQAGDPLFVVETDKVENEVGAPATGTLRQMAVAGETYAVGAQLGEIETRATSG